MSFVLLLSLAGNALAQVTWDNQNGAGDRLWQTALNWNTDTAPVASDWATIDDYADDGNGPIINAGTNAVCDWLDMGEDHAPVGEAVLTMTGGSLTATSWIGMGGYNSGIFRFDINDGTVEIGNFYVGYLGGSYATVNISGGTINIAYLFDIGAYETSEGYVNMTGGTVTVGDNPPDSWLDIGSWDTRPGYGRLDMHGGTIHTTDMSIGHTAHLDITEGVITVERDLTVFNGYLFDPLNDTTDMNGFYTGTIQILADRGVITAYDVNSGEIITDDVNYPAKAGLRAVVNANYDITNPGVTTIWAEAVDPNLAWNEKPSSGSTWQPLTLTLSWSAGDNAASHDVYFGTSFTDVNTDVNTGGTFIDNRDTNSYSPPGLLALGQTYYWRIDEVNGVNTWKGIVWNFTISPGTAINPSPADEASDVSLTPLLSWTPGIGAVDHQLYFSADFDEVNDRSIAYASPAANSYDPGTLLFDTTYYWAVDEVNNAEDPNVWPGDLWQFTTVDHLDIDDMDSYGLTLAPYIYDTWIESGTATVDLQLGSSDADYVVDGNSMDLFYNNDVGGPGGAPRYAEVSASTSNLEVGSDWTIGSAVYLQFKGLTGNDADPVYFGLEDSDSDAIVYYDSCDVNAVTEEQWHDWYIDLEDFNTAGVDLDDIQTVHIGVGPRGATSKRGDGTVYFDEIELWPSYCRSELFPADINGDCRADIADLRIMSADWLVQDYNFIAELPSDANLIGWWKLDEGTGDTTLDSSIYENDGDVIEASWTIGYPNDPCDSALDFSGDGIVYFDHVACAVREGNTPGTYPAELMPDTFTVACWTKLDSFEYFSAFVGNGIDDYYGFDQCGFFLYNDGFDGDENFALGIRTEVGQSYVETGPVYEQDVWYHLAATYDGNYASVYVDGLLAAGPTDVGGPIRWVSAGSGNYPDNFVIGAWLDDYYELYVNGAIDEVRYYDYALPHGEIVILAEIVTPGSDVYQPVPSRANIADPEIELERKVNFVDYAIFADDWLVEQLWP
jgi:hypothetical protein